jgi:ABC-type nitrate/sulfonate/bicarbonate transport system substrate-binding protein
LDGARASLAAAVAGSVQFAFTGPNIVDAVVAGIPVVAIYALDNVSVGQVCAHNDIKNAKDLIGKTVTVPNRGSAPDVTFRIWLEKEGIDDSKLTIRNISAGTPAVMAAAASNQVQAFTLNPPRCYLNEKAGFHVLADLGSTGMKYFNAGVAVSRDYLTEHRDMVEKFVASLDEALKLFKQDKNVAFEAIEQQDKVTDPDVRQRVWEFYKKYWADPPSVDRDAMLQAIKYSSSEKTRRLGPAMVEKMYDNSVVEGVLKK